MSIKLGEKLFEWVLLHIRNGEQYAGMVEVAEDLRKDADDSSKMQEYYQAMAADLMQPKVNVEAIPIQEADRIITLRNPHQVMIAVGPSGRQIANVPLDYGTRTLYLRSGEVLFAQFLDDASPIVKEIKAAQSPIKRPADGLSTTPGGLVLPGQGGSAQ